MYTDPILSEIPARLLAMSENELVIEQRLAQEALTKYVMEHFGNSSNDTPEGLAAELRLIEAELSLNVKVRESTIQGQMAVERARGELTPAAEQLIRSLARGTFAKEIDRLQAQLRNCRNRLQFLESSNKEPGENRCF
jgi:hypothetical protein